MVDVFKCARAAVYHNTRRLTAKEIKAETGCSHIINGGFFNTSFQPCGWLVIDGKTISQDQYQDWGFALGDGWGPEMTTDRTETFLSAVPILKDGKRLSRELTPDVARPAARTAVGWFPNGRVLLWCDKTPLTRNQLQDKLLGMGVSDALMLDGGGSTQGIFPRETVESERICATFLLFWAEDHSEEETGEEENNMFKLALSAGHGINTAGKRCLKALDPNETREWWLNDRICDHVEDMLRDYEGYCLLRLDDSDDGQDNPALAVRAANANKWGADFYLSVHHNAGINGGSGGGIIAYVHPDASAASREWQSDLYDALINHTGLKGNRGQPKAEANYQILRETNMPAVLLELGFMDSKTDVPIILTDEYAQQCARAIVEVLAERGKLTKKAAAPAEGDVLYKVQVGAFAKKENAEKLKTELAAKGYPVYMVRT